MSALAISHQTTPGIAFKVQPAAMIFCMDNHALKAQNPAHFWQKAVRSKEGST